MAPTPVMRPVRTRRGVCLTVRRLLPLLCLLGALGCSDRLGRDDLGARVAGGDHAEGARLMRAYGCVDCHVIPGIRGANAVIGPPLTNWSNRAYVAGLLPNNPDNLILWLLDPRAIDPRTAMPTVGLTEEQAAHVAAYLFTIR